MTVCCGAGTLVADLDEALAAVGQCVAIPPSGTVGGALAVGRSGLRRLGYGPIRDTLAAGPLRVGGRRRRQGGWSDGEERQRVRPVPAARRFLRHARVPRRGDPADAATGTPRAVVRDDGRPDRDVPSPVPTDVGAVGRHDDVGPARGTSRRRGGERRGVPRLVEAAGPPNLPTGGRWSIPPSDVRVIARRRSSPRSASASCITPTRRLRSR